MAEIKYNGKLSHKVRSSATLLNTVASVLWQRFTKTTLTPDWSVNFEIGTVFWRKQYIYALNMPDIRDGRAYLDSLITLKDDRFKVTTTSNGAAEPKGDWHVADGNPELTILYLHGSGYSLYPKMDDHFGKMLADYLEAKVFMADYRLIPENPHPAQLDDGLAAYKYLLEKGVEPSKLVIIGDSGGGHLALKLVLELRKFELPQPTLAICLCPWTGIGDNIDSITKNDPYDVLQSQMMGQFTKPLPGQSSPTEVEITPIELSFKNVAPIYIQGGGREVMIDLIRDFATKIHNEKIEMTYDEWPKMVHVFQKHGKWEADSAEAFDRMKQAIAIKTGAGGVIPTCPRTINSSN